MESAASGNRSDAGVGLAGHQVAGCSSSDRLDASAVGHSQTLPVILPETGSAVNAIRSEGGAHRHEVTRQIPFASTGARWQQSDRLWLIRQTGVGRLVYAVAFDGDAISQESLKNP